MTDKFYLTETQALIVTDTDKEKKEKNLCDIKINYPYPLYLNRRMECALVKLICPTELKADSDDLFDIQLHLKYFDLNEDEVAPPLTNDDWDGVKEKTIDYSFRAANIDAKDIRDKINSINESMRIESVRFWERRYNQSYKADRIKDYKTDEDYLKAVSAIDSKWTDMDLEDNHKDYWVTLYKYQPLQFFQNETNDSKGKWFFKPGYFFLGSTNRPYGKTDTVAIHLIAYVSYNHLFHKALNIDESKYPLVEFIPEGYNVDKEDAFVKKVYGKFPSEPMKRYTKYSDEALPINYSYTMIVLQPDIIYVYCDIIVESHVNSQKVNILQTFLNDKDQTKKMQTIEFKNIIHIPLRVEEILSITIQFRDKRGEIVHYKEGSVTAFFELRPIEHL